MILALLKEAVVFHVSISSLNLNYSDFMNCSEFSNLTSRQN
jgi:hypothetical protein